MPTFIPPLLGLVGLVTAFIIFRLVLSYSEGNAEVKRIGDLIHSGAMKFMRTEYVYLLIFVLVLTVLVYFALNWQTAVAVVVGASSSALAGFIGMYAATNLILELQLRLKIKALQQLFQSHFMVALLWVYVLLHWVSWD